MQRRNLSISLLNKLETLPEFACAKTILLYHSLPDEVFTHEFAEKWKDSKTVLLPVVIGEELELRIYTGKQDLAIGAYGIEEPAGTPFEEFNKIDFAIIPGVSFDASCNRLGRGKGYYDRLLPKLTSAYKIGICFSFQVCEQIPIEEFDMGMNAVLTEKEIFIREDKIIEK